ncbi:hypothetical protein N9174_04125, partial [bacterium]|nr:hypothetical protein [bacterium]
MNKIELEKADPKNLTTVINPNDVRKDLHVFACYCRDNEIKRAHRDNSLPKVHLTRLAKMMANPQLIQEVRRDGNGGWIDFIDRLNLDLELIDYATEGIYAGYSSSTESYPDNYIDFLDKAYDQYLNQSLQEQEDQIRKALVDAADPCLNEFFTQNPLSTLNRFSSSGCATGTMKYINFPKIRSYLFELIANCRAGVWYRTASLIAYLKSHNPFFLISEKIPFKKSEYEKDRYHNFHEAKPEDHFARSRIRENSKDRFERVEGRFVERFLEGIPLALGYVDVAYTDEKDTVFPSINKLQAFRVTDRGACALNQAIKEADITLLPNYEIHIDSLFYPARQLNRLMELCDVVHEDTHTVFKLAKKKVIKQHATDTGLNVIDLFKALGIRVIPENVKKELVAWAGHADNFVVYQGFGLLEGKMDKDTARQFAAFSIAADAHIVRQPKKLFEHLEQAQKVPAYVKHSDHAFKSLGDTVQSKFSDKKRAKKPGPRKKRQFTLKRTVHLILEFPDNAMFEAFTNALLDKGYALDTNKQARTVSYAQKDEAIIKDVLNSLKKKFPAVI